MHYVVLLIDDDADLLAGLQRALRKEPYEFLLAASASEGRLILKSRPVDAVIVDHEMPGISGLEFLAAARNDFPEVIRIMLTGSDPAHLESEMSETGAIERFFSKPCDTEELREALHNMLEKKEPAITHFQAMRDTSRKSNALERLETAFPGITKVEKDTEGFVVLDDSATGGESGGR